MRLKRSFHFAQRGLSLVELMIALAIGLILSAGLIVLVSNTSRAFNVDDSFARLQENGSAALRYLVDDIRMAGFYGLSAETQSAALDATSLSNGGVDSITNDCTGGTPPFVLNLLMPIDVRADASGLSCIAAANFAGRSPVIILRGATGRAIEVANLNADTIYVQSEPTKENSAVLFTGAKFASLPAEGKRYLGTVEPPPYAPIFAYQSHIYYVRPCSRPASAACAAGDDGIPTLVRHQLDGSTLTSVALVEGVERIALVFGLDSDNNGVADQFVTALPLSAAQLAQLVSIRVSVLVRSVQPAAGYSDVGRKYDLGDGTPFECSGASDCSYRRHVFSQIALVRNCAGRRGAKAPC